MLAAYTELKNAQKVKQFLTKKKLLNNNYLPIKELNHIYFPVTKKVSIKNAKIVNTKLKFKCKPQKVTINSILKLTDKQLSFLPKSQEIVGKIMILEVPKEIQKKEKQIAEAYLKLNKNITTVVKKERMHEGVYRTRKVKILAGKRTKETIHNENGVKLKLHLEKTYFSARSANERLRIAKQVKPNENVLVMFSGAGPFPLVMAKNAQPKKITAIELNPAAHQFALKNAELNKVNIHIKNGDVRKILPRMKQQFDRIAMPLPKTGEQFLPLALKRSKKGTIIHLYAFLHETEIKEYSKHIKQLTQNKIKILRKVRCGQFSPGTFRMCFDLKVL